MVRLTKKSTGSGRDELFYLELEVDGEVIEETSPQYEEILTKYEVDVDGLLFDLPLNEKIELCLSA